MTMLPSLARKQVAILDRLFCLGEEGISPAAARALLKIDFDQIDVNRMHELSLKAQSGALDGEERKELDFYSTWGNIVDILHSKARLALKKRGLAAPVQRKRS